MWTCQSNTRIESSSLSNKKRTSPRSGKPFGVERCGWEVPDIKLFNKLKGLILAQNERWRHGLGMQVERESDFGRKYSGERVSNAWTTYL